MDEVCFQYPSSSGFFTAEIASNSRRALLISLRFIRHASLFKRLGKLRHPSRSKKLKDFLN